MEIKNESVQKQDESNIKMTLTDIKLDTELSFNTEEVNAMIRPYLNKMVTFKKLHELTADLTAYFRKKGYPACAVYIPAQTISSDRVLTLSVITGRYGTVKVDNQSHLSMKIIKRFTDKMKAGDIITSKHLETLLYNLSDY